MLRTGECYFTKFGSLKWTLEATTFHGARALTGFLEILGKLWLIGGNIAAPAGERDVEQEEIYHAWGWVNSRFYEL